MGYFASLVILIALSSGEIDNSSQMQLYLNLATNVVLFIYLSWNWLQRKLKGLYLPIALLAAMVVPIFSNLFYLAEPIERDLPLVMVRGWLLFPILIVPLALIAWQYGFIYVLAFTVIIALVELGVLYPVLGTIDLEDLSILGLPLIRAFAFGTVGQVVSHLVATQEAQSKALIRANYKLSRHADTLEQLAVSRERNRLAREIHDTLAHTLSGQAVNLEAIKLMLSSEQTEVLGMLDQALEYTRAGLNETRRALKDLRSLPLEDLGLAIAIRNLAQDAASRAGFILALDITNTIPDLPPDAEQCIYRIAQESLENIVRHANASQVRLRLGVEEHCLQMIISDNGVGVDLEEVSLEDKLGLQGMRERAAEIRAMFDVRSQTGQGTTIRLSVEVLPDEGNRNDQSIDM